MPFTPRVTAVAEPEPATRKYDLVATHLVFGGDGIAKQRLVLLERLDELLAVLDLEGCICHLINLQGKRGKPFARGIQTGGGRGVLSAPAACLLAPSYVRGNVAARNSCPTHRADSESKAGPRLREPGD
jgi:hypothetical protein